MKYTIEINQYVLSKTSLDIIDASILNYLYYLCSSKSKKIEDKRKGEWTWVDYKHLLEEMPLLKIKSIGALTPRITKIANEGYIELKREEHQKLYIKITEKIDELFIQVNRAIHVDEQSYSSRRTDNNTIYNNTNIDKESKILYKQKLGNDGTFLISPNGKSKKDPEVEFILRAYERFMGYTYIDKKPRYVAQRFRLSVRKMLTLLKGTSYNGDFNETIEKIFSWYTDSYTSEYRGETIDLVYRKVKNLLIPATLKKYDQSRGVFLHKGQGQEDGG